MSGDPWPKFRRLRPDKSSRRVAATAAAAAAEDEPGGWPWLLVVLLLLLLLSRVREEVARAGLDGSKGTHGVRREGGAPNILTSGAGVVKAGVVLLPPSPSVAAAAVLEEEEGDGSEYVFGLVRGLRPPPPMPPVPLPPRPPWPSDWSKERLLETGAVRKAGPTLSSMAVVGFFAFVPLSGAVVAVAGVVVAVAEVTTSLLSSFFLLLLLSTLLLRLLLL